MLDFIFILLIFFEILFTVFCVNKLIVLEKRVIEYNKKLDEIAKKIIEINKTVKDILKKLNKIVSLFTNQKLILIRRIISLSFDTFQILMLLKSIDFSKGLNFSNIRKIFLAGITKDLLMRLFTCAP